MKIKNGMSYKLNGWTYISVKGKPKERGYALGYLCADSFKKIQEMLHFLMYESYGKPWSFFIEKINDDFKEMTKTEFNEFYEEMLGIAEGCTAGGCKTTVDEIIDSRGIAYILWRQKQLSSNSGGRKLSTKKRRRSIRK